MPNSPGGNFAHRRREIFEEAAHSKELARFRAESEARSAHVAEIMGKHRTVTALRDFIARADPSNRPKLIGETVELLKATGAKDFQDVMESGSGPAMERALIIHGGKRIGALLKRIGAASTGIVFHFANGKAEFDARIEAALKLHKI